MFDNKRALLLAISHELRSPLTRVRLNAELLPEEAGTLMTRDALLRDLAQMRDLISDLLESERLSGTHVVLNLEAIDLGLLVQAVIAADSDFAQVRQQLQVGLPMVSGDNVRLRLALRNLLDNAVRHGGGVEPPLVSLTLEGALLKLVERDFGPGVHEVQLGRLAEPFYRTDEARQRSTGGVGLGLYLSRLVAQAQGGSLHFENTQPGLQAVLLLPISGAAC